MKLWLDINIWNLLGKQYGIKFENHVFEYKGAIMTNFSDEKFIICIRRICHMVLRNIQEIMQRRLE
jgi:hypothetical protein